jgi:hypothetical protein
LLRLAVETLGRQSGCVPKRKTTFNVDEDVLRAAEVMAARKGKRDSDIFEEALRQYVGFAAIDRIRARNTDLTPEEAERLAYEAVHERGSPLTRTHWSS